MKHFGKWTEGFVSGFLIGVGTTMAVLLRLFEIGAIKP